jgi:hypothetical protein
MRMGIFELHHLPINIVLGQVFPGILFALKHSIKE